MRVEIQILTHYPYRVVCDPCAWFSSNYEWLSQAATAMNEHKAVAHVPIRQGYPAPAKPSTIR